MKVSWLSVIFIITSRYLAGYSPENDPPQGEILIHGSNIALGYYKNEEKTREDFITINGKRWFASGDIGEFRADGSMRIM